MFPQQPAFHQGKRSERFPLRIEDGTGYLDVTVWDGVGFDSCYMRTGQCVVLEGLSTTDVRNGGIFCANCSPIHGAKIHPGTLKLYYRDLIRKRIQFSEPYAYFCDS